MSALVRIRPASVADAGLWRLTRDVAALLAGLPWVLIGGQMVAIIEAEHGATTGRTTGDVDRCLTFGRPEMRRSRRLVAFTPQASNPIVTRMG